MAESLYARARQVFLEAIEIPESDRSAWLDARCGDDVELRERLDRLLKADPSGETSGDPPSMAAFVDRVQPGQIIADRYRLQGVLGTGGFGIVYEAEQIAPVKRAVALKLILPGRDSASVLARFEAERQALALMDHPSVASVLDGGVTEDGRPFFVMELVRGLPVTEHCDRHGLGLRERIELLIQICEAVQHAHSKGVIHRDLKPSNILVEHHDGRSRPKVIDFGIAKALDERLAEATIFTRLGQMIGTPEYMSPEQAGGEQDIDTRTDVYALGAVLYEMLTGCRPFEPEMLRGAAEAEMLRIIREVIPDKPSTRLKAKLPPVRDPESGRGSAGTRGTDVRSFHGVMRRDLDWVVMKCLEKDRERRYDTASALGAELRRFLDDEPVLAGPPSVAYRAAKFAKRNKVLVGGATTTLLALLVAVVLLWHSNSQARRIQQITAERRLAELHNSEDWAKAVRSYAEIDAQGAVLPVRSRARWLRMESQVGRGADWVDRIDAFLSENRGNPDVAEALLARAHYAIFEDDETGIDPRELLRIAGAYGTLSDADKSYASALLSSSASESTSLLMDALSFDGSHPEARLLLYCTLIVGLNVGELIQRGRAWDTAGSVVDRSQRVEPWRQELSPLIEWLRGEGASGDVRTFGRQQLLAHDYIATFQIAPAFETRLGIDLDPLARESSVRRLRSTLERVLEASGLASFHASRRLSLDVGLQVPPSVAQGWSEACLAATTKGAKLELALVERLDIPILWYIYAVKFNLQNMSEERINENIVAYGHALETDALDALGLSTHAQFAVSVLKLLKYRLHERTNQDLLEEARASLFRIEYESLDLNSEILPVFKVWRLIGDLDFARSILVRQHRIRPDQRPTIDRMLVGIDLDQGAYLLARNRCDDLLKSRPDDPELLKLRAEAMDGLTQAAEGLSE